MFQRQYKQQTDSSSRLSTPKSYR